MPDCRLVAVGAALTISVLAGCSAAPTAVPVSSPQTSVAQTSPTQASPTPDSAPPSPTLGTSTTTSPTPVASETPTPSLAATESPTPTPTPSTPAINTYAFAVALSGNQLSYTRLRWYWAKAAQARCKKKHLHSETEWCNDYYYENTHRQGRGTLATDARIRLLSDDGQLHAGTAAQLASSIRSGTWRFYRIWSSGDQIVRLEQVFTP